MYIREFNMQTWVINLKVVVYTGENQVGWMAWPWSDGLGCEHLAILVRCETETEIAHLFMKELGHGQVGWDVVSLGLQGFLVPALSLLGLASLHVHLT